MGIIPIGRGFIITPSHRSSSSSKHKLKTDTSAYYNDYYKKSVESVKSNQVNNAEFYIDISFIAMIIIGVILVILLNRKK